MFLLRPRVVEIAALTYRASTVLPFYSGARRSSIEESDDARLGLQFPGRIVFSNLFPSQIRLSSNICDGVRCLLESVAHLTFPGVENLFQAAKCTENADALFLAHDITPRQAADYGQAKMILSNTQKQKLISYGANPDDFIATTSGWKRKIGQTGAIGRFSLRPDWEEAKATIMLQCIRDKFSSPGMRAYMSALFKHNPFFVEHTRNDACWADGDDGHGCNYLGKILTKHFLELRRDIPVSPLDMKFMRLRNDELVEYAVQSKL